MRSPLLYQYSSYNSSSCFSDFQSTNSDYDNDDFDKGEEGSSPPLSSAGYYYQQREKEDESKEGFTSRERMSLSPLLLPTPFWQIHDFEKQLSLRQQDSSIDYSSKFLIYLLNSSNESKSPHRPSLLPHDISRCGSNVSIRDISPSSSSSKFEKKQQRKKQTTSAQFFISPELNGFPIQVIKVL